MGIATSQMYDSNVGVALLGYLVNHVDVLRKEKYLLTINDFPNPVHQIIFGVIYNSAADGINFLTKQDITLEIAKYEYQKQNFEANNGGALLDTIVNDCQITDENVFERNYETIKKYTVLRDLNKNNINVEEFVNTGAGGILEKDEKRTKLDSMSIPQILDTFRIRLANIEKMNFNKDGHYFKDAGDDIDDLIRKLEQEPDIGFPLFGERLNYISRGGRRGKMYLYSAGSGGGKALPNDTIIPMADGTWKQVGEVKVGDYLIDRKGKPTRVEGVFPQGQKNVYEVRFASGKIAKCCDEHLWSFYDSDDELITKTLREMIVEKEYYRVPLAEALAKNMSEKLQYWKALFNMCDDIINDEAIFNNIDSKDICVKVAAQLGLPIYLHSDYISIHLNRDVNYDIVVDIKPLNYQTEMTCFMVDNEEHLFLMNDYITTHNTRFFMQQICYRCLPRLEFKDGIWKVVEMKDLERGYFVSVEQEPEELQTMILAFMSGVEEHKMLWQTWTQEEKERVQWAAEMLKTYKDHLYIDRIPEPSIQKVRSTIVEKILDKHVSMVVYDYIAIPEDDDNSASKRQLRSDQVLMQFSAMLKEVAVAYNIFMLTGTQITGSDPRNKMVRGFADIRDGKSIADKADFCMIGCECTDEEYDHIKEFCTQLNIERPNYVIDVYKNRSGVHKSCKVYRNQNLGNLRTTDLLMTTQSFKLIDRDGTIEYEEPRVMDIIDFLTERKKELAEEEKRKEEKSYDD